MPMLNIEKSEIYRNGKTQVFTMQLQFNCKCWGVNEWEHRIEGEDQYLDLKIGNCSDDEIEYIMSIDIPMCIPTLMEWFNIDIQKAKTTLYIYFYPTSGKESDYENFGKVNFTLEKESNGNK